MMDRGYDVASCIAIVQKTYFIANNAAVSKEAMWTQGSEP
jgi:hypothetical protein